jgi:predicted ArsR family transcriptional regulator
MSSLIQLREPPPRTATGRRPIMPLDRKILEIASSPMRPVQIANQVSRQGYPGISTQRVASRLKALVARGLAERQRPSGGPRNGPGTSLYKRVEDTESDG